MERVIKSNGDTAIQFNLADAKAVLSDLLDKAVVDSLLSVYVVRDSLNTGIISLNEKEIKDLKTKCANKDIQIDNLMQVKDNFDAKIALKDAVIEKKDKEIKKHKAIKVIALIGDIVLPVLVILLVL